MLEGGGQCAHIVALVAQLSHPGVLELKVILQHLRGCANVVTLITRIPDHENILFYFIQNRGVYIAQNMIFLPFLLFTKLYPPPQLQ